MPRAPARSSYDVAQGAARHPLRRAERPGCGLARPLQGHASRPASARSLRKNTDKLSGWIFDHKATPRLATRTTDDGSTEILSVEGDALTKVYSCTVFERCNPVHFHKDNKRVYLETNKGDVDLSRLVAARSGDRQGRARRVRSAQARGFRGTRLLGPDRRAHRDELRGRPRARTYFRGQGVRGRLQTLEEEARPARTWPSTRRPPTNSSSSITADERHRARRDAICSIARPRRSPCSTAILEKLPRAAPGADEGGDATPRPTAWRSPRISRCRRAFPPKGLPADRRAARRPVGTRLSGATTRSRSSSPIAATPCCSRTSAGRPATARSSSTPATRSGARRCRTTSPGA